MAAHSLAIIGMRRSGTSSISLALNRLGVSFGEESQLWVGDSHNPEGYWEHRAVTGLHRRFRMSLNLRSPDYDPIPEDWLDRPATGYFLERGVRCLKEHFGGLKMPWAWKDPDASLILPYVYKIGEESGFAPHALICIRNPMEVARSEERRKGIPELETVGTWLAHTLACLQETRSKPRTVVLFSKFLENPRQALAPTVEALGMSPSDPVWKQGIASVRPDLVHHRSEDLSWERYPSLAKRVYDLGVRISAGPSEAAQDELEQCSQEFEAFRKMFWRPVLEEATLGALWEQGGGSRFSQVSYRPTGGWQTVSIETGALPASPVYLYMFPLPANVWIRRARWQSEGEVFDAVLEPGRAGNFRNQFGMACVSLIHGQDQLKVKTPSVKGRFTLHLEFLIETNNLIVGETYKWLSERSAM